MQELIDPPKQYLKNDKLKIKAKSTLNACDIENENTNPINPDTSTNENPIKHHLTSILLIIGLRLIDKTKNENIKPTPIATPAKQTIGILEAEYLNPSKILVTNPITRAIKWKSNNKIFFYLNISNKVGNKQKR